ncbi:MAG: hypothetical protein GXP08_13065 [Gammaproteobacteria bacterium]|nr:hypothetical protein [Gammaproteobacteria bacterium]
MIFVAITKTSHAAFTHDPSLTWQTLTTPHFQIHYHDDENKLAHEVADIAEKAHLKITRFFNWVPDDITHIVLRDRTDFANGFASPIPHNTMTLFVTPPDDVNIIGNYHNWLESLIIHEYTHIVHIDKAAGIPRNLRDIFGRVSILFPNSLQPLWILEGIATYQESRLVPGIGRGNNNEFKTKMRLEVATKIKPISHVNQPNVSWPAGDTRYLYGVYFFNFLEEQYGVEKIKTWVDEYSDNILPFSINSAAKSTFGKNMATLWQEFSQYLQLKFEPDIKAIKAKGLVEGQQITRYGYFTGYPRSLANGDIYFLKQDFLANPKLMLLAKGKTTAEEITSIYSGRFDIHPTAGALVAQIDYIDNVNLLSDLHVINTTTGKTTQLTRGKRYTHASWSPGAKQIVAVQTIGGTSELHLLSSNGNYHQTLWQGQQHEIISALDWAPDGQSIVAAIWRTKDHWNLEQFNLATQQWKKLTDTPESEFQPQFSHDGNSVLYSADYDGVYNIRRLMLDTGEITTLTNVIGGALSATPTADGRGIYYMGANTNGTDIYHLTVAIPISETPKPGTDAPPPLHRPVNTQQTVDTETQLTPFENLDSYKISTPKSISAYSAIGKITPTTWFPLIEITEERSEIGFTTFGSDPLRWHQYSLFYGYDTDNRWSLGALSYRYDRWNPALKLFYQRDILTNLNDQNELIRFRNSDTLTSELIFPHLSRDRQWALHFGVSVEEESDKKRGIKTPPLKTVRDGLLGTAISFNSSKRYPRGISTENGQRFRAVVEDSEALENIFGDNDFSGQVYTLDWRALISLGHKHVLAARLVWGWGTDSPNRFRLGGSSDGFFLSPPSVALSTSTTEVFNKRDYALRGYPEGLPNLIGRRMALTELEWRFPVYLLEKGIMAPPIGIHQFHGTLFYSAGNAWEKGNELSDLSHSAGVEINTELVLGYFIPLNLRLGYAHGFDEGGEDKTYLEVGFSF